MTAVIFEILKSALTSYFVGNIFFRGCHTCCHMLRFPIPFLRRLVIPKAVAPMPKANRDIHVVLVFRPLRNNVFHLMLFTTSSCNLISERIISFFGTDLLCIKLHMIHADEIFPLRYIMVHLSPPYINVYNVKTT
jgi:hypothetical protein